MEGDCETTCGFYNEAENIAFNNPIPFCLREFYFVFCYTLEV